MQNLLIPSIKSSLEIGGINGGNFSEGN